MPTELTWAEIHTKNNFENVPLTERQMLLIMLSRQFKNSQRIFFAGTETAFDLEAAEALAISWHRPSQFAEYLDKCTPQTIEGLKKAIIFVNTLNSDFHGLDDDEKENPMAAALTDASNSTIEKHIKEKE